MTKNLPQLLLCQLQLLQSSLRYKIEPNSLTTCFVAEISATNQFVLQNYRNLLHKLNSSRQKLELRNVGQY